MRGLASGLAVLCALTSASSASAQAGDADRGKRVYAACGYCHGAKGTGGAVGPTLKGVIGRKAAMIPNFNYSPALKSSGLTWTEANLADFLRDPRAKVKGNRMVYAGLKKPQDVEDVIAFIKQIK